MVLILLSDNYSEIHTSIFSIFDQIVISTSDKLIQLRRQIQLESEAPNVGRQIVFRPVSLDVHDLSNH